MVTVGDGAVLDEDLVPEAVRRAVSRSGAPPADAGTDGLRLRPGETLEARLREVEAALLRATLEAAAWNQSAAARSLGITETKIRNRMKQYGIHRPDDGPGGTP
jgi:DNA-binding NtrC family response regulator